MATVALQVGSGNDDGREPGSGTPILNDASEIAMLTNSANTWLALRFTNVTVPQGSTVNSAPLEVYIVGTSYDDPDVDVYLEDADNSPALTTSSNNISGRTKTTAKVTWSGSGLGAGWKPPGDLAAVVEGVFTRPGWASGNAVTVLFDSLSSSNNLRIRPYEYDTSLAAKLTIDYTAPGGANHVISRVSRVRLASKVGGGLA